MILFDTHAHLDQQEFDQDRPQVIARAAEAGVNEVVIVGTTRAASEKCVSLANPDQGLYAAVGIQPNYVHEANAADWQGILDLLERPGVVAIGETGLDRYWDFAPFDQQQEYFDRHMQLARERQLPFIVHMRACDEDILAALRAEYDRAGPLRGVMHSFTGDAGMAAECVRLGMHISFAGMVTFKKSEELRACAATVPADRLLIETDSPYLSPEPVRKIRRNEPAHLLHTAEHLARVRGIRTEHLAEQTTANARRLFGLD